MNPFIRLKRTDGVKIDINANQVAHFYPSANGTMLTGPGVIAEVSDSAQAVRGAIRRAFNPKDASVAETGNEG